jgi:hypothetical protein
VVINLECRECGNELEGKWTFPRTWDDPVFVIDPCETCLDKRAEEATEEGRKDGYTDGFSKGQEAAT